MQTANAMHADTQRGRSPSSPQAALLVGISTGRSLVKEGNGVGIGVAGGSDARERGGGNGERGGGTGERAGSAPAAGGGGGGGNDGPRGLAAARRGGGAGGGPRARPGGRGGP